MNGTIKYPRRKLIRKILQGLNILTFRAITKLEIIGNENIPDSGPLLMIANHFGFVDPVAMVRVAPWHLEFLGGFNNPSAPVFVRIIPKLWGYYPLFRGTGSRDSLKTAEKILKHNGMIGIFPEGGSWATVLRPARPGTAFLATRTKSPLLPMAFTGLNDIIPSLRKRDKAKVQLRIGKVFGPYEEIGHGRERRRHLDEIGHEIMEKIAELLPDDKRGYYAREARNREAAKGTEKYPWYDKTEHDLKTGDLL